MRHGAALAVVAAVNPMCGCLVYGRRGRASYVPSYLVWPASASVVSGGGPSRSQLLQRYQFAARLAPHLRTLVGSAPEGSRLLLCGALKDLRAIVNPLSEEVHQPIEVLDEPTDGLSAEAASLAPSPAAWQLAWTVACQP
jgi:hypothetical protein